jgi:hypothetical protein
VARDIECALFSSTLLRDMAEALKVEYYADFEARNSKVRRIK